MVVIPVGLLAWAFVSRGLVGNPRGDVDAGLVLWVIRMYSRWYQRMKIVGAENIPDMDSAGPLIVLANHTAGIDPLLLIAACRFEPRWMMAQDMRVGAVEPFWQWARIIFIDPAAGSMGGARHAIRHLRAGGQVGLFPEGGLERPAGQIRPFGSGVGLLLKKSRAKVLPIVIDGTPTCDTAWGSLWRRGRCRLRVMEPLDYSESALSPDEIADELRGKFLEWTGWEANDNPPEPPPRGGK